MIVHECKHGLTKEWCSYCKEKPLTRTAMRGHGFDLGPDIPSNIKAPSMEARFESTCPDCGIVIDVGDVIGNREGDWVCVGCAYTYDVAEAKEQHPSGGTTNG